MESTTVQIGRERRNGLMLHAKREKRSITGQLDWILTNAGIPRLSDRELEAALKKIDEKVEVTA